MGQADEKRCEGSAAVRVVPRGVYKILQTKESPIEGMDVEVSDVNYGEDRSDRAHIITYVKKK